MTTALSIVLPAHNEAEYLLGAVDTVVAACRDRGWDAEVLVVENGSTDATAWLARRLEREYPEVHATTCGVADYGAAIARGLEHASADAVVKFDVDLVDMDFAERALAQLDAGAAIVLGTKRGAGARDDRGPARRLATGVLVGLLKVGFGLKASDTHGLQAFRRDTVAPLAERVVSRNELFDTELVLRAERTGLEVAEVPAHVRELRPARVPLARRVPRTLVGLVRLRLVLWREGRRRAAP